MKQQDKLYYDATRGELESLREKGELPEEMEGIVLTSKNKFSMATDFEKMVLDKKITLLDDNRQLLQILAVDNDLQALSTEEGHGDSFFSICLAIKAFIDSQGVIIWEV